MSLLYLATDAQPLAGRLARNLDQQAKAGDCFVPATIVVPHRFLGQWLQLWLARQQRVAANLRFQFLEGALWELLRAVDPRRHDVEPEMLDKDSYRLLVLSILLENRDPDLSFWQLGADAKTVTSRRHCRRLWNLADLLGQLIRDYEYHRQDDLIQRWLKNELGLTDRADLERAQRAVFRAITHLPDGKRARLNDSTGRNFKTLPQYAMEVWEIYHLPGAFPEVPRIPLTTLLKDRPDLKVPIHLFGLSQVSALHLKMLRWLATCFDLRIYSINALAGRLAGRPSKNTLQSLARRFQTPDTTGPGAALLSAWNQAGAESLWLLGDLLSNSLGAELVPASRREVPAETLDLAGPGSRNVVLARLQDHLLVGDGETSPAKLPQDRSLQIVACPGVVREVETVQQSILDNLARDPSLRLTDIAVYVTDLGLYRSHLKGIFERGPTPLHYNLADYSAAAVSVFGQALVGMLDLALESFRRTEVLEVLLNPCFLAALGVDRGRAAQWLEWARALGVYQGWDRADKKERGYADSSLFGWRLGLRRLRLGRLMETTPLDPQRPAPRFGPVVPYADLPSGDRAELNAFCLAVEGLLPRLLELKSFTGSGEAWAQKVRQLADDFLAVPEDRPEEGPVRERLLSALGRLALLDKLGSEPAKLSLALIRAMAQGQLEGIEGRGQALTGITVGGLQPLRPVPFRIVYILGLGEALFPGSNNLAAFDLRGIEHRPGDIRPAEFNRYLLLEALLSARDKVYLSYVQRDLQKDQDLYPCVPLLQLKRYLNETILDRSFEETKVPIQPHDVVYLQPAEPDAKSDVLAQYNPVERLLALDEATRAGVLALTPEQKQRLEQKRRQHAPDFTLSSDIRMSTRPPTVSTRDLKRFLENPALAGLQRHLGLRDEDDDEPEDDEPLVAPFFPARRLVEETLHYYLSRGMKDGPDPARQDWPQHFQRLYEQAQLQGQVPEAAFGVVDRAALQEELAERIDSGLARFLDDHPADTFCGPVLLGESYIPLGARQRFGPLIVPFTRRLEQFEQQEVRIIGSQRLAWRNERAFEVLIFTQQPSFSPKEISATWLESALFFFALKAGPGREWLGDRAFTIHVTHATGLDAVIFGPEDVSADEARAYLAELATDLLDPTCFDLLPMRTVLEKEPYKVIPLSPAELAQHSPEEYRDLLLEELTEKQESPSQRSHTSPLLGLIDPKVPADALAKAWRRFHLLDRAT